MGIVKKMNKIIIQEQLNNHTKKSDRKNTYA